jgi:hypothetical protein
MEMRYYWLIDRVCQKNNLISIGAREKAILRIIIVNIIQHNITKICSHSSHIIIIAPESHSGQIIPI